MGDRSAAAAACRCRGARDRAAQARDVTAARHEADRDSTPPTSTAPDRGASAIDRVHSGRDRDGSAADRADLIAVPRQTTGRRWPRPAIGKRARVL